jgi:hypothetical protein
VTAITHIYAPCHIQFESLGGYSAKWGIRSMSHREKDLATILKIELEFLEKGGYRAPEHAEWRPQLIFQDSPTCLNYGYIARRIPCSGCALMKFVPAGHHQEKFPCRHIPLDESGETLDSLYRTATEEETHTALSSWLRATIEGLESGRADVPTSANSPNSHGAAA